MNRLLRSTNTDIRKGKLVTELNVNGSVLLRHDGPISPEDYQRIKDAWLAYVEGRPELLCDLTGKTAAQLKADMDLA